MTFHEDLYPVREQGALSLETRQAVEERPSELCLQRCVAPQEALGRGPMASRNEVRDRPTIARHKDP